MKIYIGSDHGGFQLKTHLVKYLNDLNFNVEDCGCHTDEFSFDYPDIASMTCEKFLKDDNEQKFGILICGTGVGISMSANRNRGIRCALCNDMFTARMTRLHNDANFLALGGRVLGTGLAEEIVKTFIHTGFSGEQRHVLRIAKI